MKIKEAIEEGKEKSGVNGLFKKAAKNILAANKGSKGSKGSKK